MPWTSKHLEWLRNTGAKLKTVDGKSIEVWEFLPKKDDAIMSAWAKHFRNHYCLDDQIDELRKGTALSRADFLNQIKFPDAKEGFGPGIRSGDFGEVLVADFVEFIFKFWVPRTRYSNKAIRNESTKGSDIIGFKFVSEGKESKDDLLTMWEAKVQFSGEKADPRLQEAIDGSAMSCFSHR